MKSRNSLAFCMAAAVFLCSANSTLAVDPTQPYCALICPQTSCDADCIHAFQWTKCAVYNGQPVNDWDGDGVPNSSDNCRCTYNSNQANCDGDGFGDACDLQNVKWVKTGDSNLICSVTMSDHIITYKLEAFTSETWTELCSNASCVKRIEEGDNTCWGNVFEVDCCEALMDELGVSTGYCFYLNKDVCGNPACPF